MVSVKMEKIFMDYAGTTSVDPRVAEAMMPFYTEKYGNAASLHSFGQEASESLERSREVIMGALGAKAGKLVFTSSATESNNLALKGGLLSGTSLTPILSLKATMPG